jgi:hypothetical protein
MTATWKLCAGRYDYVSHTSTGISPCSSSSSSSNSSSSRSAGWWYTVGKYNGVRNRTSGLSCSSGRRPACLELCLFGRKKIRSGNKRVGDVQNEEVVGEKYKKRNHFAHKKNAKKNYAR